MCGAKLGYHLHSTTAAHRSTVQKGRPWVLGCQDVPAAALRLLPGLQLLRSGMPGSAVAPGLQLALRGDR